MQEDPTGSERPGDQQPPAGEPTPPLQPPRPEGSQPPPPPPSGGPGYPAGQGYPAGRGYPGPGQAYPPHGGYPPTAPRRLTRRTDDRVLAGVASGLGAYFGVDPVIFRIGFVALTLASGAGLLIYLLLWAVLPAVSYGGPPGPPPPAAGGPGQGDPPIVAALRHGGAKHYLAIGAVILAVLLLVGPFTRPPVVFALLLIGVGVLLMVQDRPEQTRDAPAPWPPDRPTPPGGGDQPEHGSWPQPPEQPERGGWSPPSEQPQGGQGAPGAPSQAAYATATQPRAREDTHPGWGSPTGWGPGERDWAPGSTTTRDAWAASRSSGSPSGWGAPATAVARRRPRSALGWLTVAAALLAVGVASALDNLGVVNLTPGRVVALVLTVIGIGLLVGSVWGRAWWLILLGLLLVPVMAVASVAGDVPIRGRTGQQLEQPASLAEVQSEYRLSAGQLTLDLRRVDFGSGSHRIMVRIGAGDLQVVLPNDQPVTVISRVGVGEVQLLGHPSEGGLQVEKTVSEGNPARLGRLTLDLRVSFGQIVVTRGP